MTIWGVLLEQTLCGFPFGMVVASLPCCDTKIGHFHDYFITFEGDSLLTESGNLKPSLDNHGGHDGFTTFLRSPDLCRLRAHHVAVREADPGEQLAQTVLGRPLNLAPHKGSPKRSFLCGF